MHLIWSILVDRESGKKVGVHHGDGLISVKEIYQQHTLIYKVRIKIFSDYDNSNFLEGLGWINIWSYMYIHFIHYNYNIIQNKTTVKSHLSRIFTLILWMYVWESINVPQWKVIHFSGNSVIWIVCMETELPR